MNSAISASIIVLNDHASFNFGKNCKVKKKINRILEKSSNINNIISKPIEKTHIKDYKCDYSPNHYKFVKKRVHKKWDYDQICNYLS